MNSLAPSSILSDSSVRGDQWPPEVSRQPTMTIGQLRDALYREFPSVTVSKIRYLESQNLVTPQRTSTGYRKYSKADAERIRFILTRQRDSYTPLAVIRDELCALDAGHNINPAPAARVVASDGKVVVSDARPQISARDLADLTGTDIEALDRYTRVGLISPDIAGYFPIRTVHVVQLLRQLEAEGFDARYLRSVRTGAERSTDLIDQTLSSQRARHRSGDLERANARSLELGELFCDLHRELLRVSLSARNRSL